MNWTAVLVVYPLLALIPAALLLVLWRYSRSKVPLVAALLWVLYTVYEYALPVVSPDADIRIDLLLIYPVLILATLAGLWFGFRKARR